jgi:hypothetical protein
MTLLPSHASDGVAGQHGHDVISRPSHADDGIAVVIWPRIDVYVKSCWRWRYRVMLTMTLPSHADDGTVETSWPRRDVDAMSC